jgi:hypothetical protein
MTLQQYICVVLKVLNDAFVRICDRGVSAVHIEYHHYSAGSVVLQCFSFRLTALLLIPSCVHREYKRLLGNRTPTYDTTITEATDAMITDDDVDASNADAADNSAVTSTMDSTAATAPSDDAMVIDDVDTAAYSSNSDNSAQCDHSSEMFGSSSSGGSACCSCDHNSATAATSTGTAAAGAVATAPVTSSQLPTYLTSLTAAPTATVIAAYTPTTATITTTTTTAITNTTTAATATAKGSKKSSSRSTNKSGRTATASDSSEDEQRRRSSIVETARVFAALVKQHVRTLAFCRTRKLTELVLKYSSEDFNATAPHLTDSVRGYRGGYTKART